MMDNNSTYPTFKSRRGARSFAIDARVAKEESSREFSKLLHDLYPGYSNAEIARKAGVDLGISQRTVEYWLTGTTAPGLHSVVQIAKRRGYRLIIEPIASTVKFKLEQVKKERRNG